MSDGQSVRCFGTAPTARAHPLVVLHPDWFCGSCSPPGPVSLSLPVSSDTYVWTDASINTAYLLSRTCPPIFLPGHRATAVFFLSVALRPVEVRLLCQGRRVTRVDRATCPVRTWGPPAVGDHEVSTRGERRAGSVSTRAVTCCWCGGNGALGPVSAPPRAVLGMSQRSSETAWHKCESAPLYVSFHCMVTLLSLLAPNKRKMGLIIDVICNNMCRPSNTLYKWCSALLHIGLCTCCYKIIAKHKATAKGDSQHQCMRKHASCLIIPIMPAAQHDFPINFASCSLAMAVRCLIPFRLILIPCSIWYSTELYAFCSWYFSATWIKNEQYLFWMPGFFFVCRLFLATNINEIWWGIYDINLSESSGLRLALTQWNYNSRIVSLKWLSSSPFICFPWHAFTAILSFAMLSNVIMGKLFWRKIIDKCSPLPPPQCIWPHVRLSRHIRCPQ